MLRIAQVFGPGELLSYCITITNQQLHQEWNISQVFEVVDMLIYWQDNTDPFALYFSYFDLEKPFIFYLKEIAKKRKLEKNVFGSYYWLRQVVETPDK